MLKRSKFFELLAVEVAGGSTICDAAGKTQCAVSTAYNVSCDPSFRIRVSEIRSESVRNASGKLSRIAGKAVDVLEQMLDADDNRDRLNAAKMILTQLVPLSEHSDLRERLDRLEAAGNAD